MKRSKDNSCGFNLVTLFVTMVLYFFNQKILKRLCPNSLFFHWYFNDLLAPVVALSAVNFFQGLRKRNVIETEKQLILFWLLCAVFWELLAKYIKPSSTFDLVDIVFYFLGIHLYLIILKLLGGKIRV